MIVSWWLAIPVIIYLAALTARVAVTERLAYWQQRLIDALRDGQRLDAEIHALDERTIAALERRLAVYRESEPIVGVFVKRDRRQGTEYRPRGPRP